MMNGKLFYGDANPTANELDFVILSAGDERLGRDVALQRNLRLGEQAEMVRQACVLLHYTLSPQMYADMLADIQDDKSWLDLLKAWTVKNLSWAIGTCRAKGIEPRAILLASRSPAGKTTDVVWLYKTLEKAMDAVYKAFGILVWAEFEAMLVANRSYDPQRIGETLMARYEDVSVRELGDPTKGKFSMFALKDRTDCFWRYANDSAGNVEYLYYGNLYALVGYKPIDVPSEPPVVTLPTEPPDEITLTRLERALMAAAHAILNELESPIIHR